MLDTQSNPAGQVYWDNTPSKYLFNQRKGNR